ncbi:unnamed protein product [marine sediment metagenome]|uniref:Uncharacterized protein n=1 Tax=marine sediment metagenome TaxID=412755 RepID=X1PS53_9ZZZZ
MFREDSDSIIGTDFSTFAAVGALLLIQLRDRDRDCLAVAEGWLEEDMSIRLLYITIKKLKRCFVLQGYSQAGGYQGFPGATLATGNGYYHIILSPSLCRS